MAPTLRRLITGVTRVVVGSAPFTMDTASREEAVYMAKLAEQAER